MGAKKATNMLSMDKKNLKFKKTIYINTHIKII